MSTESLACTYAALLLHDAGLPPTADRIEQAVTAAGVTVRPTLPILFARLLQKKSIDSLIAASAAAPAAAAPVAAAGGAAPAAAGKEDKKKKEEVVEEGDDDMGFGLFD